MLDRNILYQNSANELTLARNYQSKIARNEFEICLMDINSQYSSYANNYYSNNLQKLSIESEINNLQNYRNSHICNAIDFALQLAEKEIRDNIAYSMASMAINSINSFLTIYKPKIVSIPLYLRDKLTTIYCKLLYSPISHALHIEITKLKELIHLI